MPLDPWIVEQLDAFIALHDVEVARRGAARARRRCASEHEEAAAAIRRSRATERRADRRGRGACSAASSQPFQWAGVRYALDARRCFLADEQGLGKTVEALATLEADGAYPGDRRLPGVAEAQLGARDGAAGCRTARVAVVEGRVGGPAARRHHDPQLRDRRRARARRSRGWARGRSSSTSRTTARTRAPSARRRCAGSPRRSPPDGLRLALTGTPVLNHAEELIAQLRVIGRLEDFGSGARFARIFGAAHGVSEERLHWHLRRRCFVRRLKSEVLPQLPAKRQVVVPVALDNEHEYRLAEKDVIEWLRTQPLDLSRAQREDRGDAARAAARAARHAAAPGRARQAARGADLDPRLPRLGRAARRLRPPRRGPGGGARALPRRRAPARPRRRRAPRGGDRRLPVARRRRS